MQLIWNKSGIELERLNKAAVAKCTNVLAAVAYVTDTATLIESCFQGKKPLTLFARYDATGPIADDVLNWFLAKGTISADYQMRLVADVFHPKVIWWKGVGAYVGSANLSKTAWFRNIEAGIFLSEEELDEHGIRDQLDELFESIQASSDSLTRERADQMIAQRTKFGALKGKHDSDFEKTRLIPRRESVISITRRPASHRRRDEFVREWSETLEHLRAIGARVSTPANLPRWLKPPLPLGVVADQFLHAYYYNQVKDGAAHPYPEWHERNKLRRNAALNEAIDWWRRLPAAPNREDVYINKWAPFVESQLSKSMLQKLTPEAFVELCKHIHAARDHAGRLSSQTFGIEKGLVSLTRDQQTAQFATWLYDRRASNGKTTLEVIDYVLYGGSKDQIQDRLFEACFHDDWKISHMSVSTLGEMIGWAMPNDFPPRNGRTSKSLAALGYEVTIHTE